MIRQLVILLGIFSLTYFTGCGGDDNQDKKPPKPPAIGQGCGPGSPPPGAVVAFHTSSPFGLPPNGPNGGPFGSPNAGPAFGPGGIGGHGGPPPGCHQLSPQDLTDLQNHFARARQVCCSVMGPYTLQAAATYQLPGVTIPPPFLSQCDNDVRLAMLLANTMYGPWGGSAFPPLDRWIRNEGKETVNCIAKAGGLTLNSPPGQLAHAFGSGVSALQGGQSPNLWGLAAPHAAQAQLFFQQLLALR